MILKVIATPETTPAPLTESATLADKVFLLLEFEVPVLHSLGLKKESHFFADLPFKLVSRMVQLLTPATFERTWTVLIADQFPRDPRPIFEFFALAYLTLIEQTKTTSGLRNIKPQLEKFEVAIKAPLGLKTAQDRAALEQTLQTHFDWAHLKKQLSVLNTDQAIALALKGQEVQANAPDSPHRIGLITDAFWRYALQLQPERVGPIATVFNKDIPPTPVEWHQVQLQLEGVLAYFPLHPTTALAATDVLKFRPVLARLQKTNEQTIRSLCVVFSSMVAHLSRIPAKKALCALQGFWQDVPRAWVMENPLNSCLVVLDFQNQQLGDTEACIAYGHEAASMGIDWVSTPGVQERLKRNFLATINQPELPHESVLSFFLEHASDSLKATILEKLFEKIKSKQSPEKAALLQVQQFKRNLWLFPKENQTTFGCFRIFAKTFLAARKAHYAEIEKTSGHPVLDPALSSFIVAQRNLPLVRAILLELVTVDHPYVTKDMMEFLVTASQFGLSQEEFDPMYEALIHHFSAALKQLHSYNRIITVASKIKPIHFQLSTTKNPLRLGFNLIELFFVATRLRGLQQSSQLDDSLAKLAYFSVFEDVAGHAVRLLDTLNDDGLFQFREFVMSGIQTGQHAGWLSSTMYLNQAQAQSHLRLYTNMLRILMHYLFRACVEQDDALVVMYGILELALSIQSFSKLGYPKTFRTHLEAIYSGLSRVGRDPRTNVCNLYQFNPILRKIFDDQITPASFKTADLGVPQLAASSASAS